MLNDAKAETPVLWPPHAKSWLIGKDSAAGRDWGQEEKGTTEDEMAGWHHWLDGRESQWTPELVMDREAWHAVIHAVAKSWTRLSDWTELNIIVMITTGFLLGTVNAPCSQSGELLTLSCISRATDREALLLISGLSVCILSSSQDLKHFKCFYEAHFARG